MEGSHPHVALGAEEFHDQLALVELEVEVELDDAHVVGSSSLGFLLEELPLYCAFAIAVGDGST